jgi:hypothetical protein
VTPRGKAEHTVTIQPLDLSLNPQFQSFAPPRLLTQLVQLIAEISKIEGQNDGPLQVSAHNAATYSKPDFRSLKQLSVLAERLVKAGIRSLELYSAARDLASKQVSLHESWSFSV